MASWTGSMTATAVIWLPLGASTTSVGNAKAGHLRDIRVSSSGPPVSAINRAVDEGVVVIQGLIGREQHRGQGHSGLKALPTSVGLPGASGVCLVGRIVQRSQRRHVVF